MSNLADALKSGKFVVTTELNPPKGTTLGPLFNKAERLRGVVDAFNLTDSHSSRMSMAPLAVGHLLLERGIEPILQLTCRDKNRIALQSDLLGADALGISNVLCMSGDHPSAGDHPDAKPVFDLDAIALLRAISSLQSGEDLGGKELKGSPSFFAGAVVNPGAPDLDKELRRMEQKIEAGCELLPDAGRLRPPRIREVHESCPELRRSHHSGIYHAQVWQHGAKSQRQPARSFRTGRDHPGPGPCRKPRGHECGDRRAHYQGNTAPVPGRTHDRARLGVAGAPYSSGRRDKRRHMKAATDSHHGRHSRRGIWWPRSRSTPQVTSHRFSSVS